MISKKVTPKSKKILIVNPPLKKIITIVQSLKKMIVSDNVMENNFVNQTPFFLIIILNLGASKQTLDKTLPFYLR